MCLTPCQLPNGQIVGCRKCWQCTQRKIDDWAGRCIAENKTSASSIVLTLTYGPDKNGEVDHIHASVLTYSDIQKFWKRLRKDGYKFKYLVAGEYGTLKGRAHWHAIIFFEGKTPQIEKDKTTHFEHWPHGHVLATDININSATYLCKYILKDEKDEQAQSHFAMSKKPPIGTQYFKSLAEKYVKQGLVPQTPVYSFSDILNKNGKKKEFYMSKTVLRDYLRHFINTWSKNRQDHMPPSQLVEEFLDAEYRETNQYLENEIDKAQKNKEYAAARYYTKDENDYTIEKIYVNKKFIGYAFHKKVYTDIPF